MDICITDAAKPVLLRRYDTAELATGIAVKDNLVFISLRIYGIEILDCTEPVYFKADGLDNMAGTATTDGKIVVLTSRDNGSVYTLDFTDPEKASVIPSRSIREFSGSPGRAVIYKGRIFIPAGHSGILYETSDK